MSLAEVINEEVNLHDFSIQQLQGEEKSRTPGLLERTIKSHNLYPLLTQRVVELEREADKADPISYLGPFSKLSTDEIREYFLWRADHRGGSIDDWRRSKARSEKAKDNSVVGEGRSNSDGGGGREGCDIPAHIEIVPSKKEVKAYGPRKKGKEAT